MAKQAKVEMKWKGYVNIIWTKEDKEEVVKLWADMSKGLLLLETSMASGVSYRMATDKKIGAFKCTMTAGSGHRSAGYSVSAWGSEPMRALMAMVYYDMIISEGTPWEAENEEHNSMF